MILRSSSRGIQQHSSSVQGTPKQSQKCSHSSITLRPYQNIRKSESSPSEDFLKKRVECKAFPRSNSVANDYAQAAPSPTPSLIQTSSKASTVKTITKSLNKQRCPTSLGTLDAGQVNAHLQARRDKAQASTELFVLRQAYENIFSQTRRERHIKKRLTETLNDLLVLNKALSKSHDTLGNSFDPLLENYTTFQAKLNDLLVGHETGPLSLNQEEYSTANSEIF